MDSEPVPTNADPSLWDAPERERGRVSVGEPPHGFTVEPIDRDSCTIHHRRTDMGCMVTFIAVWVAGWSFASIVMLVGVLTRGKAVNAAPVPVWALLIFWIPLIYMAGMLAYLVFCRKTFQLTRDNLTVDTRVLMCRWHREFPRDAIQRLRQVQDGGRGRDSFPSWGLQVEAAKPVTILYRLPYGHSLWLGRVLATWADVRFDECDAPRT